MRKKHTRRRRISKQRKKAPKWLVVPTRIYSQSSSPPTNPPTKTWEAWQLAYPTQPYHHGRPVAICRIRHHLMRKIAQHHEKEQAKES